MVCAYRESEMTDRSNGYEGIAAKFLAVRVGPGSGCIGAEKVRAWARQLAEGSAVLDLGCGAGVPVTEVLIDRGLAVYGVVAWGLVFLLSAASQRELIGRISDALKPGGRLLFTSPAGEVAWNDLLTGQSSLSLGAAEYQRELSSVGLTVLGQYDDEGMNHYFDVIKESGDSGARKP